MELCKGEELEDLIKDFAINKKFIPEDKVVYILNQILRGL